MITKKAAAVIVSAVLTACTLPFAGCITSSAEEDALLSDVSLGDADGDGKVDASDATSILVNYSILSTGGISELTDQLMKAADVNEDGKVDSSDATYALQYYSYTSTGGLETIEKFLEILENIDLSSIDLSDIDKIVEDIDINDFTWPEEFTGENPDIDKLIDDTTAAWWQVWKDFYPTLEEASEDSELVNPWLDAGISFPWGENVADWWNADFDVSEFTDEEIANGADPY